VWATAALVAAVGVLVTAAVCVVGLGRYLEDYCLTRFDREVPELSVVQGPFLRPPATVECRSVDGGVVLTSTDVLPALWVLGCAVAGVVVVVFVVVVARRVQQPAGNSVSVPA
jgi:hypothetical protein